MAEPATEDIAPELPTKAVLDGVAQAFECPAASMLNSWGSFKA